MFCTMSRVSGSIMTGPRGLSHLAPFMASTAFVPSILPFSFLMVS